MPSTTCLSELNAIVRLNTPARLDPLNVACLNGLGAFAVLNALCTLVSLNALRALGGLNGGIDFSGLQSLRGNASACVLHAIACLNPLNVLTTQGVRDTPRANAPELSLEVGVSKRNVAVMGRVESPTLKLTATSDTDSIEPAVKNRVGLDRCVAWMSPTIVVPKCWPYKERSAKPKGRPDSPPTRIPKEGYDMQVANSPGRKQRLGHRPGRR